MFILFPTYKSEGKPCQQCSTEKSLISNNQIHHERHIINHFDRLSSNERTDKEQIEFAPGYYIN